MASSKQPVSEHEASSEEQAFLRGVVQGLMDLNEELDLADVKKRLGLS